LSDVRYGLRMEYGFRDFFLVSVDHPNPAHERGFFLFFIFYFCVCCFIIFKIRLPLSGLTQMDMDQ
jgi:hypothetical protein